MRACVRAYVYSICIAKFNEFSSTLNRRVDECDRNKQGIDRSPVLNRRYKSDDFTVAICIVKRFAYAFALNGEPIKHWGNN